MNLEQPTIGAGSPSLSTPLLACPFCGQAPIKFGNETTCECDNKACGIYGVAVEIDLWQLRHANAGGQRPPASGGTSGPPCSACHHTGHPDCGHAMDDGRLFICTRVKGHDGPHVACGVEHNVKSWPNDTALLRQADKEKA